MRKITFILLLFSISYALYAQTDYPMTNTTITGVCTGVFTDSNAGGFTSGGSGNYGNNENYTMTFCSGSTETMAFMFSGLEIGSGDHLKIYDGPNTSSPLLFDISNSSPGNLIVSSTGTCITFVFTSDGSGNMFSSNGNWSAGFMCGTIPNCSPNPATTAADACANAPSICSLNGYCGNTSDSYTADRPGNMCDGCALFGGSLENNSWLKLLQALQQLLLMYLLLLALIIMEFSLAFTKVQTVTILF